MILKLAFYVFDHECIVQDENEEKEKTITTLLKCIGEDRHEAQ